METEFKYVGTTRQTYLCESVEKHEEGDYTLHNAMPLEQEMQTNVAGLANAYVRSGLMGTLKKIDITATSMESISGAEEETRLIKTLQGLVPEAQRRGQAKLVYNELSELVNREFRF